MSIKLFCIVTFVSIAFVSCQKKQEAQRPIEYSSGSFMKKSVDRNKDIFEIHEEKFQEIFCKDSLRATHESKSGFWYTYEFQSEKDFRPIKKGDFIFMDYEIRDIDNNLIYPIDKFKDVKYRFEKENIFSGLREGLRLLKKDDIVIFYFPSQVAYGFHGDNNKISSNTPLIVRVKINDILYQ